MAVRLAIELMLEAAASAEFADLKKATDHLAIALRGRSLLA
jgi:hypothetical protein